MIDISDTDVALISVFAFRLSLAGSSKSAFGSLQICETALFYKIFS